MANPGTDPNATADVQIDWGQTGLLPENLTLEGGTNDIIEHEYPATAHYTVRVEGELDKIQEVGVPAPGTNIDVSQLPNLVSFRGLFNDVVTTLDLSGNHQLQNLDLLWLYSLTSVTVPSDAPYNRVRLDGIPLTTTALDDLIDDIYAGVVWHDVHNGYFQYYDLPNALTPASLDQLESLQNDFGWTLEPAIP